MWCGRAQQFFTVTAGGDAHGVRHHVHPHYCHQSPVLTPNLSDHKLSATRPETTAAEQAGAKGEGQRRGTMSHG